MKRLELSDWPELVTLTRTKPRSAPRQRISFKRVIDALQSFTPVMLRTASKRSRARLHSRLLEILADDALPARLGRHEPRAVKNRPKPYPLLTKHRRIFIPLPHKGRAFIKRP
jgi:hypothetical protein